MTLVKFRVWESVTEGEHVFVNPAEVAAVREYRDRRAYGGFNDVSKIVLNSGESFVVCGHAARELGEVR